MILGIPEEDVSQNPVAVQNLLSSYDKALLSYVTGSLTHIICTFFSSPFSDQSTAVQVCVFCFLKYQLAFFCLIIFVFNYRPDNQSLFVFFKLHLDCINGRGLHLLRNSMLKIAFELSVKSVC